MFDWVETDLTRFDTGQPSDYLRAAGRRGCRRRWYCGCEQSESNDDSTKETIIFDPKNDEFDAECVKNDDFMRRICVKNV